MITLSTMSRIEYEDRTNETEEAVANRQIEAASRAIIGTAILASQGNPLVGIEALTRALGHGAARTGMAIDDVVQALRASYEVALRESNDQPSPRISDA